MVIVWSCSNMLTSTWCKTTILCYILFCSGAGFMCFWWEDTCTTTGKQTQLASFQASLDPAFCSSGKNGAGKPGWKSHMLSARYVTDMVLHAHHPGFPPLPSHWHQYTKAKSNVQHIWHVYSLEWATEIPLAGTLSHTRMSVTQHAQFIPGSPLLSFFFSQRYVYYKAGTTEVWGPGSIRVQ